MPSDQDFAVRIAGQGGVSQQQVGLDTLVDWYRRRIITPETEVRSSYYTGGLWMKVGHVNLDDCVRHQRTVADVLPHPPEVRDRKRFCVHCGSQLADAARFCGSCGTAAAPPLVRPSPIAAAPSNSAGAAADWRDEENREKAQKYIVYGAAGLAIGLALAFVGNNVANQAESQARWSLYVGDDVQTAYRVGKALLGGGIAAALMALMLIITGFAKK